MIDRTNHFGAVDIHAGWLNCVRRTLSHCDTHMANVMRTLMKVPMSAVPLRMSITSMPRI